MFYEKNVDLRRLRTLSGEPSVTSNRDDLLNPSRESSCARMGCDSELSEAPSERKPSLRRIAKSRHSDFLRRLSSEAVLWFSADLHSWWCHARCLDGLHRKERRGWTASILPVVRQVTRPSAQLMGRSVTKASFALMSDLVVTGSAPDGQIV